MIKKMPGQPLVLAIVISLVVRRLKIHDGTDFDRVRGVWYFSYACTNSSKILYTP